MVPNLSPPIAENPPERRGRMCVLNVVERGHIGSRAYNSCGAHKIINVVVAVACVVLIHVVKEGNGEVKVTLDGVVHFGM